MGDRIWSRAELERFLRWEDPEVRCWAADRLARHYPDESTAAPAPYRFDDHDLTPEIVAAHLGRHGGREHHAHLARAVKSLRGMPAARALEALVRLKAPNAMEQVRAAAARRDFDADCWAAIVEALADRGD